MRLKKLSRGALLVASLLCIAGFAIMFIAEITDAEPFVSFDVEWMGLLPAVPLMLVALLVGSFGGSLPLVILGEALPVVLLISFLLVNRNKLLYRITVYPILLASVIVTFGMTPGEWLLIVPQILYFVLAILADSSK